MPSLPRRACLLSGCRSTVCNGGSLDESPTGVLDFSGGTLTPGETCTFSVVLDVPATATSGSHTNTTSDVTATVTGVTAAGNPATDDLRIAGLVLTKEFTDDPVIPGATVTLRFVISNVSATEDATSISFTDDIGATLSGLAVILPLTTGTCDGTLVDLFGVLTYFGGSLIAGASCTFDVTLAVPIGAASGTYANSTASLVSSPTPPAPSGFFAIMSGSGSLVFFDDARDDLIVNSSLLALTKEFTDDPVSPGDTVTLEFTLTNLSTSETVTDIAFTDDLAAILPGTPDVTVISVDANDCGGTVGGVGTSLIDFSGGTLAPADSCTIELSLSVPGGAPTGTFPNVTSDVTGTAGGLAVTGAPTSDDLLIQTLTFTKSFDGPTVAGGTPRLTFTIVNLSTSTVSDLEFTDNLDAVISGLEAASLPKSSICGASSMIVGTDFLAFTGGELLPLGTCSFFVDLLVPATATAGTFPQHHERPVCRGSSRGRPRDRFARGRRAIDRRREIDER